MTFSFGLNSGYIRFFVPNTGTFVWKIVYLDSVKHELVGDLRYHSYLYIND